MLKAMQQIAMRITRTSRMFQKLLKYFSLCFLICSNYIHVQSCTCTRFSIKLRYTCTACCVKFFSDLDGFLNNVVENEEDEDALARQHEEVHRRHVPDELHSSKVPRRNGATCRRELDDQPVDDVTLNMHVHNHNKQQSSSYLMTQKRLMLAL